MDRTETESDTGRIITVTLNPSLNRTVKAHFLAEGYQNRAEGSPRLDPAGKCLNIARAVQRHQCATHAIVLVGADEIGATYRKMVAEEGFGTTFITVDKLTRSRTIILDTGKNQETEIIEDEGEVSMDDLHRVADALKMLTSPGDVVVLGGTLPTGAPADTYGWLTGVAREQGAQVAIDARGEALLQALQATPDIVSISRTALEGTYNHPVRVLDDVIANGRKLCEAGAKYVLIPMGEERTAVFVSPDELWKVVLPEQIEGTSTGTWSAFFAGLVTGWYRHYPVDKALRLGGAAAAYTSDHVGVEFGHFDDLLPYLGEVTVEKIAAPSAIDPDTVNNTGHDIAATAH